MMRAGFFASKQFVVAAVVAGALIVGGLATYAWALGPATGLSAERGCDAIALAGTPLTATPTDTTSSDGTERHLTWDVPADAFHGGDVRACGSVASLSFAPSSDASAHVRVIVDSSTADATRDTKVSASFADAGGKLAIAVWQSQVGYSGTRFFGHSSADTSIVIEIPTSGGAFDVRATNDVGETRLRDLLVGNVSLTEDVGDIIATGLDVQGNVTAQADVGNVDLRLNSVGPGTIQAAADVGDTILRLPLRADIGYDVRATTDVGSANVAIGDTEVSDHQRDTPGETWHARSKDYATKPTRIAVTATADTGNVDVTAA